MKTLPFVSVLLFVSLLFNCNSKEPSNTSQKLELDGEKILSAELIFDTVYLQNAPKSITRAIIRPRPKGKEKSQALYIASFEGLRRYHDSAFYSLGTRKEMGRFFSILEDQEGQLWATTIGEGIYYYDGNQWNNLTTEEGLVSDRVPASYLDSKGNIWFGTEAGGSRYDGNQFKNFTIKDGLPNSDVSSITEDQSGNIWFATRDGLAFYDGQDFTEVYKVSGESFGNVRSVVTDKEGQVWSGGEDGLWNYDKGTLTQFSNDFVGNLYLNDSGRLWLTYSKKSSESWDLAYYELSVLAKRSPALGYEVFVPEQADEILIGSRMLFGMAEDHTGALWIGDLEGVLRYSGDSIVYFREKK